MFRQLRAGYDQRSDGFPQSVALALRAAAEVMRAELGWTAARTDAEIAEAEAAYAISD